MFFKVNFRQINIKPIRQLHQIIQYIRKFLAQIVVIVRLFLALKSRLFANRFRQLANFLGE